MLLLVVQTQIDHCLRTIVARPVAGGERQDLVIDESSMLVHLIERRA